jgi:hypothetical protein
MTSPASREAIASAIGLRHAFPRQTNKTFALATFFIGADSPNFSLVWRNQESNPTGEDLSDTMSSRSNDFQFCMTARIFFLTFCYIFEYYSCQATPCFDLRRATCRFFVYSGPLQNTRASGARTQQPPLE